MTSDREFIESFSSEIAEYLAVEGEDFETGPFSDSEFVRAEVENDGQLSLFTSMDDEQWPVASFDVPQLSEWLMSSKVVQKLRREAWAAGRESLLNDLSNPIDENGFRQATPNPFLEEAAE